jgi:DNA-binding MarR family transcriptional regulator
VSDERDNLVHDLIAISNDLRRHIDRTLADLGYEHRRPGFAPLLAAVLRDPVPQGRLAETLGVSPQAASQVVGLAEGAGLVARVPNPDDGRSKLVALTDHGRSFVADGTAAIAARAADYAAVLGAARLGRFDAALARLRSGLGLAGGDPQVASLAPRTSVLAVADVADHAISVLHDAMRAAGHGRITAGQNLVLVHIGPDGARSSELARAQRVSRQAVSALLHDLEALRYVRRRDDEHDGRSVRFVPTARGRKVIADYAAGVDALERRYREALGPHRFAELTRTARDLARVVQIEHALPAALPGPQVVRPPDARRQAELAELSAELLRWLGPADALWVAGALRRQVVDAIEQAPAVGAPAR